ncbi:MAG: hypothetical protein KF886_21000 [Candidatus Hydrogenedentes bacterium]|nr:hypothetical protein [Candidatus Hydrogenedentota bacterium]
MSAARTAGSVAVLAQEDGGANGRSASCFEGDAGPVQKVKFVAVAFEAFDKARACASSQEHSVEFIEALG